MYIYILGLLRYNFTSYSSEKRQIIVTGARRAGTEQTVGPPSRSSEESIRPSRGYFLRRRSEDA